MKTMNKTQKKSLVALAVTLVTVLLVALVYVPMANAASRTVRVTLDPNKTIGPSNGKFLVTGADFEGQQLGLCSDPALVAPIGAQDGSRDFQVYTISDFMDNHPVFRVHREREWRSKSIAGLMHVTKDQYDAQLWDKYWDKFQQEGLARKHGVDKAKFKLSVVHFMLGALSNNSFAAGISRFPADVQEFYHKYIFTNRNNYNNQGKWSQEFSHWVESWNAETAKQMIDAIGVINIHDNSRQAIFMFVPADPDTPVGDLPKAKGKLSINKVSSITKYTSGNSAYSLEGTKYQVYSDAEATDLVGTLTVDASGSSNELELEVGTYYVKEIASHESYEVDPTMYTVEVEPGN